MRIPDYCVDCLYRNQQTLTDNKEYLAKVREMLINRSDDIPAPYMVYLFNKLYEL